MTRGSHSLSVLATYTAALMSPTTLIVVRVMSRIRSTPMINAIVSGSTFTAASTPLNNGRGPPGTPAAPTAAVTPGGMTTACWGNRGGKPEDRAGERAGAPPNNAVPFMHNVDPRGGTTTARLGRGV